LARTKQKQKHLWMNSSSRQITELGKLNSKCAACLLGSRQRGSSPLPSPTLLDLCVQEPFETHSPTTTTTPLISKKQKFIDET